MKTDYIGHDRAYQKRYTDPEYGGWSKSEEFAADWQYSWQPLVDNYHFPKTGKLLEIGCGAGNLSLKFAAMGYDVTGMDIAPTAIAWAKENAAQSQLAAAFIAGNVVTFASIATASFDIVIDGRCLHCIIGRDRARLLQNVHRILRPGGVFVVNTMCNEVPHTDYFQDHFDPQTRCTIHDGIATRYIGWSNDILQELMQAQFRVMSAHVLPPKPEQLEDLADLGAIVQKCDAVSAYNLNTNSH